MKREGYKPPALHTPQVRSHALPTSINATQQVVGCATRRGQQISFYLSLVDEYAEDKFIRHLRDAVSGIKPSLGVNLRRLREGWWGIRVQVLQTCNRRDRHQIQRH